MTLRLVALMGVVLLLCLGAFGLLANHYQQQVLDEAAEIATDSAKAVFTTLDGSHEGDWFFANRGGPPGLSTVDGNQGQLLIVGDIDPAEARKLIEEMTQRRLGPGGERVRSPDAATEFDYRLSAVGRMVTVECQDDGENPEDCVRIRREFKGGELNEFVVAIQDIHAQTDDEGVTLTIPTFAPEPQNAESAEIRLPISIGAFENLFDRLRNQSLFMFLGVFVVGIVLSAGVAARFTRPARRLDAALRDLSDGDLETEVEVRGNDEMARLGLAFNEMTRKMRANRDRAREMVRRDKLSALGRLAAGVAHDVRNPLHSIGLTLSHLSDTGRPQETERAAEFDRSVAMIRGEIRRLDQLVVNFLRFTKGDDSERESVDLKALVEETARLVCKEAEWRGIDLVLELDEVPELELDVEAIRSSLLNLVLNSCEAMPEGGRLDIVLREEDGEVVLVVGDTGRGIPADQREKVFDFGYSTREGGSGLGLVMVHQCVVEGHGGRVTLDSEEGSGTRVRLAFPAPGESNADEERKA